MVANTDSHLEQACRQLCQAEDMSISSIVLVAKILTRTKGKKHAFWLTVAGVSVHRGREGMEEQSSSHHGGQEAERL